MINITFDFEVPSFNASELQSFEPELRVIGKLATKSFQKNFDVGGRPTKWKPSKRVIQHGGKTLILSGALRNFKQRTSTRQVIIYTTLPYAAAQNYGYPPNNLPQREYFLLQKEDVPKMDKVIDSKIERAFQG